MALIRMIYSLLGYHHSTIVNFGQEINDSHYLISYLASKTINKWTDI